jgi:hypothetical protein
MDVAFTLLFVLGSVVAMAVINYFLIRAYINGTKSFWSHHILILIPLFILLYLITGDRIGEAFIGIILYFFVISYEVLLFLHLLLFRSRISKKHYPVSGYFMLFLLAAGSAVMLFAFLINGNNFRFG